MASVANAGLWARRARRFFSTSPWTYSANMTLNTRQRAWIRIARETLHGASIPSRKTPESRNSRGMEDGLVLSIQLLKMSFSNLLQIFQGLFSRDSLTREHILEALTELGERYLRRGHHQGVFELDQYEFTALRELMFLTVGGGNGNFSVLSYTNGAKWSNRRFRHTRDSFRERTNTQS